ncbi:MAG: redoxin domain-containing protein [Candidatus Aureabacteria bacterium]|nr:redoxin domain-containing protein [Candidatus Auribacterota bacterium]
MDEAPGEISRIFIDRNNNGDLTDDGRGDWTTITEKVRKLEQVVIDVPYEGTSVPSAFSFYSFVDKYNDKVWYYRDSCREGELTSGGRGYKIALLDDNADGRFDDLQRTVLLIDLNRDGVLEGNRGSAEIHDLGQPFNLDGLVWEAASVSPDGTRLEIRRSEAKAPMRRYLNPGNPAPEFAGATLDGKTFDLAGERGKNKYVLLDFWASWCGPCRSEYPYLSSAYARYQNHGLKIVGINLDQNRDKAVSAAKENGLDYPHLFDGQAWKGPVAALYQVRGIPKTFLLDADLKIVANDLRGEELGKKLRELLGPGDEKAAAPPASPSSPPPGASSENRASPRPRPPPEPALTGVFAASDPGKNLAIISDPASRVEGVFRLHDAIGEATVASISSGEVILDRKGNREVLRLPSRPPSAAGTETADTIKLNFENADLRAVIWLFSQLTGTNFILDDGARGTVTLMTARPVPAGEALEVLASILEMRGLAMVPAGNFVKVTRKAEAVRSAVPVLGEDQTKQGERPR